MERIDENALFSLKELLAGRLQMSCVAGETTGTVSNSIPGVVAGFPRQCRPKGVEEIEKCPAHEHIVVGGEDEGDNNCSQADTCSDT